MMVSLTTILPAFLSGILCGFIMAHFAGRLGRRVPQYSDETVCHNEQDSQNEARQIEVDRLVRSIYDLTSQVDSQVGQHSQKVNEITNTLSESEAQDDGSDQILVAGKRLIYANEKLQSDLDEAKKEIERQREQLNSSILESQTDPLTGLANRRALDLELSRAFAQRRRDGSIFSVLFIDIDHFKKVNDQYGHMVGDQLLKCFARCLTNTFRETDFVVRFGGEEFVVLLRKTPLEDAFKAAERVRSVVAANPHKAGDFEIKVTASFGVKEVCDSDTEIEILQKADEALYAAKRGGRNCCYYHDGQTFQHFAYELDPDTVESDQPADNLNSLPTGGTMTMTMEKSIKLSKKSARLGNAEKSVP